MCMCGKKLRANPILHVVHKAAVMLQCVGVCSTSELYHSTDFH